MKPKTTPEVRAAVMDDEGPQWLASLVDTLARRFGCENDEIGAAIFFCMGGDRVQLFSNIEPASLRSVMRGFLEAEATPFNQAPKQ